MDRLPPLDELSNLRSELESDFAAGMEQRRRNRDRRIDEILDMLIVAYMFGNEAGNEMLYGPTELPNGDIKRTIDIDLDEMDDAIFRVIAGKDWQERVTEYLDDLQGTVDDIIRVVDTDMNRIYNDAVLDVGERSDGPVMKTWQTMMDDRVRDTHEYLQSETVPIDRRFYTFDGDSARYPGDFADPQNNINCRCRISLSMA
jgi:hypothetical protein